MLQWIKNEARTILAYTIGAPSTKMGINNKTPSMKIATKLTNNSKTIMNKTTPPRWLSTIPPRWLPINTKM
jgi:hypothetical protein